MDGVIERVYSDNYALRKRLNGMDKEETEFEIPAYMRNDSAVNLKATSLSNEEQIRASFLRTRVSKWKLVLVK